MSLVETDWLEKNLHNVKIIDCSWHMPQTKRNGLEEYKTKHIPSAIFFDLDNNSKKDIDLPHMLVDLNEWEKIVSKMGIEKNDNIIKDYESGNILSENDFVSMNFWLCKSNFFKYLEDYISDEIKNLEDITKSEIYLPFAAQLLLSKNIISIDAIDSDSCLLYTSPSPRD